MPNLVLETLIHAPAEVCFDLVRDERIQERIIETDISGLAEGAIGLGQTVTFEGRHFGIRQRLTVEVTEFERPGLFVDEMTEGVFERFKHVHEFTDERGGTLMRDTLSWKSPFGIVGRLADRLFVEPHLRDLVTKRNARLRSMAETLSCVPER